MQHTVFRAGKHSLAVVIPAGFVQSLGVKPGDVVKIQTNIGRGVVTLKFHGTMQLLLLTAKNK